MEHKIFGITYPETLRQLCIKNDWFTCGSNRQYEKLFIANEENWSIDEITSIIWVCSDEVPYNAIYNELEKARKFYTNNTYKLAY